MERYYVACGCFGSEDAPVEYYVADRVTETIVRRGFPHWHDAEVAADHLNEDND